jgi:hypothetical protein
MRNLTTDVAIRTVTLKPKINKTKPKQSLKYTITTRTEPKQSLKYTITTRVWYPGTTDDPLLFDVGAPYTMHQEPYPMHTKRPFAFAVVTLHGACSSLDILVGGRVDRDAPKTCVITRSRAGEYQAPRHELC